MIESKYWKQDLIKYINEFKPKKNPARYSLKKQVNFEKDIILSLFMVRKLIESKKVSDEIISSSFFIKGYPNKRIDEKNQRIWVNNMNYWDIGHIYNQQNKEKLNKNIIFICNQIIHGQAMYSYRDKSKNWAGILVSSDKEREEYIYDISISTIINILELAAYDYPKSIKYMYSEKEGDYKVTVSKK